MRSGRLEMKRHKEIILSDPDFHKKIINKYRAGKRDHFRLPMMVFRKNRGRILSEKVHMNILMKLHFHKQSLISFFTAQTVQFMKNLSLWFKSENLVHNSRRQTAFSERIRNLYKSMRIVQREKLPETLPPGYAYVNSVSGLTLVRTAVYAPSTRRSYSYAGTSDYMSADYRSSVQHLNSMKADTHISEFAGSRFSGKNDTHHEYNSVFESKPGFTLAKMKTTLNISTPFHMSKNLLARTFKNFRSNTNIFFSQKRDAGQRERQGTGAVGMNFIKLSRVLKKTDIRAETEDFYFYSRRKIQEEVEQIKKVVTETRAAVEEKLQPAGASGNMDVKREIVDISRLSEQVYQNIERKIRMERERRGL